MDTKISTILMISYLILLNEAKPVARPVEDAQYLTNLYNQFRNPQAQQQQPYYGTNQYNNPLYYGTNQYQQPYYGTNQYSNSIFPLNTNYQNYQTPNYLNTNGNGWGTNNYENQYYPFNSGQYPVGSPYYGNSNYLTSGTAPVFSPVNG